MARTIATIYNELITEKQTHSNLNSLQPNPDTHQTFLTDLTTTSKVAIWRLTLYLVAFAVWTLEVLMDVHEAEIEDRAEEIIAGTVRWYTEQAKLYQEGDDLVWNATTLVYEYSDTVSADALAKKIVTYCNGHTSGREVVLKVAKAGLTKLSAAEKTAFEAYMDDIKFAGTNITIISEDPDEIKITLTVYYDPKVMKSDGTLIDGGTSPVSDALDDYIEGLPFDGWMRVMDLVDAVQAATGVDNVICTDCQARFGAASWTDILAEANQSYRPYAGYLTHFTAYPVITYTASS